MKLSGLFSVSKTHSTTATSDNAFTRRSFLRASLWATLSTPFILSCRSSSNTIVTPVPTRAGESPTPQPQPKVATPIGRLNHACIGVGGMGWGDLQNFLQHPKVEIVALCDVDANNLDRASKAAPRARLYSDWRELLSQEGERIDSLNVSVPDHMHFAIAYTAIQKGKHVYCQKPLCHDVAEVRVLTKAAAQRGVVTQLGNQVSATVHERAAVIWLREGKIGKVTHGYLCSNRPGAVETYRLRGPRPGTGSPPPPGLNWDLWLGTAPLRPYVPDIYHPTKWRAWLDFGTGWSGDIGCHILDPVWKGLELSAPSSVIAEVQESWLKSPERRADTWPQGDHVSWTFPRTGRGEDELVLEWFDGEFFPPAHIRKLVSPDIKSYPSESSLLIGTEGSLLIPHGYPPQLLPQAKFKDIKAPQLPSRNHYHHFVDACLGGEKTDSDFAQTGPMTETVLLGTVAIRVPGQQLVWNSTGMKFTNNKEANQYLARVYREGWRLADF